MRYRAVAGLCALNLDALGLPISNQESLNILHKEGFQEVPVDLSSLALEQVGKPYQRGVRFSEAPGIFDCSTLTKWLYAQKGIWLPRRSIQQREVGQQITLENRAAGDLIFTNGWKNYYFHDPAEGVGHVGIIVADGSVVHAANKKAGVVNTSLERFLERKSFRGLRRYLPKDARVLTLKTPVHREIETADDIRWIILQNIPNKEI